MTEPHDNEILLKDADGGWLHFCNQRKLLCARSLSEVLPVLEEASSSNGWAAGFVGYEASAAFDSALPSRFSGTPLAWFGIYDEPRKVLLPPATAESSAEWTFDTPQDIYFDQIRRIKDYISEGDTYQVNHTIRMHAQVYDPWHLFLSRMTGAGFSAFINTGERIICSASPELFFELDGNVITCQPMKGTGRELDALARSAKDRAENIMIVDMIRNDLGRICVPGSIIADPLFRIEPYADIWQMTSTVKGETDASLPDIFKALFPCASITGAPKRRTMQIIQELESSPRGVYCGAIGYLAPERKARFSVAIRTAEIDNKTGDAVYGVGGGVVWDSVPEYEWQECALKAEILSSAEHLSQNGRSALPCDVAGRASRSGRLNIRQGFQLLETMLYDEEITYLQEHVDRLTRSASELGFNLDLNELNSILSNITGPRQRIRLLLSMDGTLSLETFAFPAQKQLVRTLVFAHDPVDPENPFLYHKTTNREIYDKAKVDFPDADDVILWNVRNEVTESTIANLVAKIDGQLVTPPVSCGLLPGSMRAALLKMGKISERIISREELLDAEEIYLINSLRGWMPAVFCKIGNVWVPFNGADLRP